jgi:hypothetical protein
MLSRAERLSDHTLARHLEGDLCELEQSSVEGALKGSLDARRRSEQLHDIRNALAAQPAALEHIDITPAVLTALRRPRVQRPAPSSVAAWMLVAAASCWALASTFPVDTNTGFVVKSASGDTRDTRDTREKPRASFQTYRVGADGQARALSNTFAQSDGLLFSYNNSGSEPYQHVMLFGVDAARQVRWYYPAYEKLDEDPASLVITEAATPTLLPDVIHHAYAPGPLTIYALFSHKPLRVSQVEAWVSRDMPTSERPTADSVLYTRRFEVSP